MDKKRLGYIYVLLAIVLWGSSAAVGKILIKNLDNLQVSFFVSIIALITLAIIVLFQNKFKVIKNYKLEDYLYFALMGFIGIFLYYIFYYGSLMFVSAQEAFIVNYTWPIWTIIFASIFLKEQFSLKKVIAILLGFIGVLMVITHGQFNVFSISNLFGDMLAFIGAFFYGLFSILTKKKDHERVTSMMFYYLFTTIYFTIVLLLFSNFPLISSKEIIGLLWLGIFPSGLAFIFWQYALKYGDTAKMSNLIFLTPFISLIYIYFLIGERIEITSILGLVLIVLGVILQSFKKK